MAITLDSTGKTGSTSSVDSLTFSHTCSGTNRILLVFVKSSSNATVVGVTYNGVSLTLGTSSEKLNEATNYIYYLIAPDTGTHNIVVTFSAANSYCVATSCSFTGVHQTSSIGGAASYRTSGASSISVTIPVQEATSVIVDGCHSANYDLTETSSQTNAVNQTTSFLKAKMGYRLTPGTGNQVASYNISTAIAFGISAIEIKQAATTNIKSINGLAYSSIKSINGLAIASVKSFNGLS